MIGKFRNKGKLGRFRYTLTPVVENPLAKLFARNSNCPNAVGINARYWRQQ